MIKNKKWVISSPDMQAVLDCCNRFGVSEILSRVLLNRDIENISEFLDEDARVFYDPYLLTDMAKAVDRIKKAISEKEKVAIYGDYDVDGITSTYILADYLTSCGLDASFYIPSRSDEGYGLNVSAIDMLKNDGITLIITVDTGITAVDEAVYASEIGMDIIITDHHMLKETIPSAHAVINPKRDEGKYPFMHLAGVGVCFKLIYALSGMDDAIIEKYADIIAIGTIADMVPLKEENRFIVKKGLEKLKRCENIGLNALFEVSGINKSEISCGTVGFGIAPRLNATGRLESALTSVELLMENDTEKAREIAENLESKNRQRQADEQEIFKSALEKINKHRLYENSVIVVSGEGWHNGIIGIVSSRITEMFYKPSVVITINENGEGKASGRSIKGFSLFDALEHTSHLLIKYGGHELAAGLTIESENIDEFNRAINEYAEGMIDADAAIPTIDIDAEIRPEDVCQSVIDELSSLEPCGIGNRQSVFCIKDARITSIRQASGGQHAFLTLEKGGVKIDAPGFNMQNELQDFDIGDYADIAGVMGTNEFRGAVSYQLVLKGIRFSEKNNVLREDVGIVYTYIKNNTYKTNTSLVTSLKKISSYIMSARKPHQSNQKINVCLTILKELGAIDFHYVKDELNINITPTFSHSTDLKLSPTFLRHNN